MKRLVAILALLLWSVSLADVAGAGTRVWCVGADGHAGIEYGMGTKCAPAPLAGALSKGPLSLSASFSHCGPCADVSLASDSTAISTATVNVSAPVEKAVPAPSITVLLPIVLIDQPACRVAANLGSPGPSPRLLEHRSVVLLI